MATTIDKLATTTPSDPVSDIVGDLERLEVAFNDEPSAPGPNYVHKPSVSPITNFPLPLELRQEIYSYLLNGGRVKVITKKGETEENSGGDADPYSAYQWIKQKFAFATDILGVNTAISAEATSYFYTENAFVLVHFDMPGFHLMANMMDLPIVAEGDLGDQRTYKRITLMITLAWKYAPYRKAMQELGHPEQDHGSVIIRMADIPRQFKMLRFLCVQDFPPSLLVASGRDEPLKLHPTTHRGQLQVMVVNQPHLYKPLCDSEQALLLGELENLLGGGSGLAIAGFSYPGPTVRRLASAMTQTLIWPTAFQKDHLAVNRELMREIDRITSRGNLSAAAARYRALIAFQKCSTSFTWYHVNHIPGICDRIYPRMVYFGHDLFCTMAMIHLRQGRAEEAWGDIARCLKSDLPMTALVCSWVEHLTVLYYAVKGSLDKPQTFHRLINGLKDLPVKDMWIVHDLSLLQDELRECLERGQALHDAQAIVPRLSIHTMPLRSFNSYEDMENAIPLPNRAALVGWRDAAHFASLSEEDKATIQKVQEANHFNVTSFE